MIAQRRGLRVHEVPVDWVDDPDSRVAIVPTALADLRGIARLIAQSRVARFLAVGVASTLAYALFFLALRGPLGRDAGNALALAATAVANTAANRRLTFGVRGREGLSRQLYLGAVVYAVTLALTSGALTALDELVAHPSSAVETAALIVASAAATATRYVALRFWVFAARRGRRRTLSANLSPPLMWALARGRRKPGVEEEPAAKPDPVKRRWLIVGGTIIALAAGGGTADDDDADRPATTNVASIERPEVEPAGQASSPEARQREELAARLSRTMG